MIFAWKVCKWVKSNAIVYADTHRTGGSVRDDESIAACNEHGIAMVFSGMRHFRH